MTIEHQAVSSVAKERTRHVAILNRMITESALSELAINVGPPAAIALALPRVRLADRMITLLLQRSKGLGLEAQTREDILQHQEHLKLIKGHD